MAMNNGMSRGAAINTAVSIHGSAAVNTEGREGSGNDSGTGNVMGSGMDRSLSEGTESITATPTTTQENAEHTIRENDEHADREMKRARQSTYRAKNRNKKMFLEQIGDDKVNAKRKVVTGSFPAGQKNLKIIDVVQCSEMKKIKLKAKSKGKSQPVIIGAVVKFGDGTYGGIEAGRFLVDGEFCHAKDGIHAGAKHVPAKRLTGVVDGYVWVKWDWGKDQRAWIHKTRIHGSWHGGVKRIAKLNEATQSQQGPTPAQFKNAAKLYAIFRDEIFFDICMKANLDTTGMKNAMEQKWKILFREKQEGNREWETLIHQLKQMVIDNEQEISNLSENFQYYGLPEDYHAAMKIGQRLPRDMERVVPKKYLEQEHPVDDEGQEEHHRRNNLVSHVVRLYKENVGTPKADRPYPRIPVAPIAYPCIDLSLEYDIIRGNLTGSLGGWRDDAIGVFGIKGDPNKFINAIVDASKRSVINERLTFQRAQRALYKRECMCDDCKKLAWNHSNSGHCYEHSPLSDKVCVECGSKTGRTWKFACKRCFACHNKSGNANTSDTHEHNSFCITCSSRQSLKGSLKCQLCL
jgi:hypothetical protein